MCYVSSSEVNEIIGEKLWMNGEWHTLAKPAERRSQRD